MSLLAYDELVDLVNHGVVWGTTIDAVNSSSIDLTLGSKILYESPPSANPPVISLKNREPLMLKEYDLSQAPFELRPGQFVLAQSTEIFWLPLWISAEYKLKSSMARSGLEHLNAGWCDAGWHGSVLTLELKNMTQTHTLVLEEGMPIGQMVFFMHKEVPADKSYGARGRYNNDSTVTGVKV